MRNIESSFEEIFGMPLPDRMRFHKTLIPVQPTQDLSFERLPESKRDEAWFLISETVEFLPLVDIWLMLFERAPAGYYMIGFHDPAFHNFYFYYARVDSWRRIYFRLNYSGVYVEDDKERQLAADFLRAYCDFEARLEGKVSQLGFEAGPNGIKYRIVLPDSKILSKEFGFKKPLFDESDFENEFSDLF